jgi:hypothetical protein
VYLFHCDFHYHVHESHDQELPILATIKNELDDRRSHVPEPSDHNYEFLKPLRIY